MELDDRPYPNQWYKYNNLVRPSKMACCRPWHEKHASGAADLEFQQENVDDDDDEDAFDEAVAAALRDDARRRYGAVHLWIKEQRRKMAKQSSLEFRAPKKCLVARKVASESSSSIETMATTTTTTTTTTPSTTRTTVEPPTKPGLTNRTTPPSSRGGSCLGKVVTPPNGTLLDASSTMAVDATTAARATLAAASSSRSSSCTPEDPPLEWVAEAMEKMIPEQSQFSARRFPQTVPNNLSTGRSPPPVVESCSVSQIEGVRPLFHPTHSELDIRTIPRKPFADARYDAARLESFVTAAQQQHHKQQQATAAAAAAGQHPPPIVGSTTTTTDPRGFFLSSNNGVGPSSTHCAVYDSGSSSSSSSSDASAKSSVDLTVTTATATAKTMTKIMIPPGNQDTVRIPRKRRLHSSRESFAFAIPTNNPGRPGSIMKVGTNHLHHSSPSPCSIGIGPCPTRRRPAAPENAEKSLL